MASGTPVVTVPDAALVEVAGDAAVVVRRGRPRGRDPARRSPTASGSSAAGLERARAFSWRATAERTLAVYAEALAARERLRRRRLARARGRAARARCRRSCPRSTRSSSSRTCPARSARVPAGVRVIENARPRAARRRTSTSASPRRAATTSSSRTPTRSPSRSGRRARRRSWTSTRAAASRARRCSGRTGRWQPSRRRFPTVGGTIVRRTPLRKLYPPVRAPARATTCLDERPDRAGRRRTGCSARSCSSAARCSTRSAAGTPGYRHYVEDIDLCYRAMRAGWERWYVPAAVVRHAYAAVIDRTSSPVTRSGTCAAWPGSSASTRRRSSGAGR